MSSTDAAQSRRHSSPDVRRLIDFFNSYAATPSSPVDVAEEVTPLWTPSQTHSSSQQHQDSRRQPGRSSIDHSPTVRASLIKSAEGGAVRLRTAAASAPFFPNSSGHPPGNSSNTSPRWPVEPERDFTPNDDDEQTPPQPRWMASVERMSTVQPTVRQHWNVVNGQLRSKLKAVGGMASSPPPPQRYQEEEETGGW